LAPTVHRVESDIVEHEALVVQLGRQPLRRLDPRLGALQAVLKLLLSCHALSLGPVPSRTFVKTPTVRKSLLPEEARL